MPSTRISDPKRVPDAILERLKSLHPKVIDLALDRVLGLLAALGDPQQRLPPVAHIAGTNGKGSTLAVLRAMAEQAGQSVHVYTSPHLVRFAERIRVAGHLIDEADLVSLLCECEEKNQGRPITFFEVTTAAAFLAFSRRPADLCLLETGLGGRFDATNVVACPAVTLLSSISLDHQTYLGDTLAAISFEKAGILKPGVPCVSARQAPEVLEVIERRAAQLSAPLFVEGHHWTLAGAEFSFAGRRLTLEPPSLPGPHQRHNAGLAAAAACLLKLPDAAIAAGPAKAEWPARLQRLGRGPLVDQLPRGWELWLDGGHNPGAGWALAGHAAAAWDDRPLYLLVGMLDTKDSQGFLEPLLSRAQHLAVVAIPDEPHAVAADDLAEIARNLGFRATAANDAAAAVTALAGQPGPARILICGSLYLAGTILAENG